MIDLNMQIMRVVSKRLHRFMRIRGINQKQLSELSGISEASISKYINCKCIISIPELIKLAVALDCHIEDLLDRPSVFIKKSQLNSRK